MCLCRYLGFDLQLMSCYSTSTLAYLLNYNRLANKSVSKSYFQCGQLNQDQTNRKSLPR